MNINNIINDQLWKTVPGFPCYEAHPTGLVRNAISGKLVGQSINNSSHGSYYMKCNMIDANGKHKVPLVHSIIALTFIDMPAIEDEYDWHVDHIDHNPKNNDARNLRWLPAKLNMVLKKHTRPEVARRKILDYYREHDIDYDYFNLLSEI